MRPLELLEFRDPASDSGPPRAVLAVAQQNQRRSLEQSRIQVRNLARWLLASRWPESRGAWTFESRPSGAPVLLLDGKPAGLSVSFSHGKGWLAVAIARGAQAGVDVEPENFRRDTAGIADYLGWEPVAGDEHMFFGRWTLWEACAKCSGTSVLERANPGFEQLSRHLTKEKMIYREDQWLAVAGEVGESVRYAMVLNGNGLAECTHHDLSATLLPVAGAANG